MANCNYTAKLFYMILIMCTLQVVTLAQRLACNHAAASISAYDISIVYMHAVQVRAAFISEDGHAETKKLAKHSGRAHKLALEPDEPNCFLSSGEDGAVISFDMRSKKSVKLLVCKTQSRQADAAVSLLQLLHHSHICRQRLAMRFGCYSLEVIQHGCQSCTASPTHQPDAHIHNAESQ